MAENERKEVPWKRNIFRVTKFTRRQVLKSIGIVAAGTAMASIPLTSACKSSSSTTAGTTTGANTTGVTTSAPPVSSSTTSSSSPTTSSPTATTSNSTTSVTSTPATTAFSYIPPTVLPKMLGVPGTSCIVATDRLYSADHIWVKTISTNIVVMGITSSMVEILSEPYKLSLSQTGTTLASNDVFGTIEGYKLIADLISPVSGTIIEANSYLTMPVGEGAFITPINDAPYNSGWLIVVQLNNPNELTSLLTPQGYVNLLVANH